MKYTKSINEELKRTIRNYNAKISRLQKTDRDLMLPEKVNLKIIKSRVSNKWQLNRELDKLQRFSERGIENTVITKGGLAISKYELDNLKREQNRVVAKLDRKVKTLGKIIRTTYGKKEDVSIAQMGTEELSNLKARRKNLREIKISSLTEDSIKELKTLINKTVQKENYLTSVFKENYVESMLSNLGYFVGFDSNKLKEIKDKLSSLSDRKFLKLFETEEAIRAIREYYDEIHKASPQNEDRIIEIFDNLYKNLDTILKDY